MMKKSENTKKERSAAQNSPPKERKHGSSAVIKTLALFLCATIPFALIAAAVFFLPGVYGNTFLAELADKSERLQSVTGEKLVIVGGSSVAFGYDSALMEELTGYPVVNFGLYATLGTKLMLDLSRDYVGEGDIIVLAPELDAQTLSLYFNAEATWQACDSDMSMLTGIGRDNLGDMLGGAADYFSKKIEYLVKGRLNPPGVYHHNSFNEYGDISYPRPYNNMAFGYDINKPLSYDTSLYDPEFVDYLNEYIAHCVGRGAAVCYTFPPMNASALTSDADAEAAGKLYDFLCKALDCEIIGMPDDYVMGEEYFFDSNFHPNAAGAVRHTAKVAEGVRRFMGDTRILTCELPEPEEKPQSGDIGAKPDVWDALFTYEPFLSTGGKTVGFTVIGTTDDARSMTALELPATHEGLPVMQLGEGALDGCDALRSLTIRQNIVSIVAGAFRDCPTLADIHIYNQNETSMSVDQNNLFTGAADGITIWLHSEESFESYITGYFWANYGSMMKLYGTD